MSMASCFGVVFCLTVWSLTMSQTVLGVVSAQQCHLVFSGILIIKVRRSWDRLTFIMGIPIPGKTSLSKQSLGLLISGARAIIPCDNPGYNDKRVCWSADKPVCLVISLWLGQVGEMIYVHDISGHHSYAWTGLPHDDGCRCPGAKLAPLRASADTMLTPVCLWCHINDISQVESCYSYETNYVHGRLGDWQPVSFFVIGGFVFSQRYVYRDMGCSSVYAAFTMWTVLCIFTLLKSAQFVLWNIYENVFAFAIISQPGLSTSCRR